MTGTDYEVLETLEPGAARAAFGHDVREGLNRNPKLIPSRYFYDDEGSKLFTAITRLEEYYPTRMETAILRDHADALASEFAGRRLNVVELGAGCSEKTQIVLRGLSAHADDVLYRPVDISEGAMCSLRDATQASFGGKVPMRGVVADYIGGLRRITEQNGNRTNLILFLGSNIGNLTDQEALEFLLKVRSTMGKNDRLLIGFDLKKDLEILHRAYDDSQGVTAEFNYNLLRRINRELGGNFDPSRFVHHPFFDPSIEAMVSWLVSKTDQTVSIGLGSEHYEVSFREGEGVRTEMSRKFSIADITRLAQRAQFSVSAEFTDQQRWFVDSLWQPL